MEEKLFLFDIDGTLLNAHKIPRKAMRKVVFDRYSDFNYHDDYDFTGRTDWEIVEHLLEYAKIDKINDKLIHKIMEEYSNELVKELKNNTPPQLHPGVLRLVKELHENPFTYLGLVTGNVISGAHVKLELTGLLKYFPVGAYGNDAKDRDELPGLAIKRATEYYRKKIERKNIWIIGDSMPDIKCAQSNNLRHLIVCTGWTSRRDLEIAKPEIILDDFSDTEKVLEILFN